MTVRALHSNVPRDLFAGQSWLDFLASTPEKKFGPWNFSAVSGRSRLVGSVLGGYVQCASDNAMIWCFWPIFMSSIGLACKAIAGHA